VAALLESELGIETELVEGGRREFSVWVGGRKVAAKNILQIFPSDASIVRKVRARLG
jgi:hypothetical protein